MPSRSPIAFVVPGRSTSTAVSRGAAAAPLPGGLNRGTVKHSVQIGAQRSTGTANLELSAVPSEDVVVLQIAGGPELVLHPETARDLLRAQSDLERSKLTASDAVVHVPAQLGWRGLQQVAATRGIVGDVLLSAFHVVTGIGKDRLADAAAGALAARFDAQVNEAVYELAADALPRLKDGGKALGKVPRAQDGGPILVLVHGTFSDTSGSFGKLWTNHPLRVRSLFDFYKQRVYGLDHQTLSVSPIENALTLATALPPGARLHLLTHSRGGLVAEVLARVCAAPSLTPASLDRFKKQVYQPQREALEKLAQLVKQRDIQVQRVVRVACPAHGTLLASKRLDAYLSVFKWLLEKANVPVAPQLIELLSEVALRRTDPQLMPGLAAQIPDSPLINWLRDVEEPIPGDLRVVAGDIEGDSVTSWLKTLMADAFYWTDNDLVVQTRSMYGGAPRAGRATYLLDQGGKVSHFNYFSNERSAEAIVSGLIQDAPQEFRNIGPLSAAGESATGVRGVSRRPKDDTPPNDKPAVFILPGILGSNLKKDGKRIWLGWRLINGLQGLTYTAGKPDRVQPDGAIGLFYEDLEEFLQSTHQVIEFAFDWRRPIEEEAQRLGAEVERAMAARIKSGQPVRILAHSMGGVLARTMQLECPDVWQRMMSHRDARLLMLGTPNAGSWAPMQVLSGDDNFANMLVGVGAPFQQRQARALMAGLPGLMQLQAALLDERFGLSRREKWEELAKEDLQRGHEHSFWHTEEIQIEVYAWGIPPQDVLDRAVALRKRLEAQSAAQLGLANGKVVMVVGTADKTPKGYALAPAGVEYIDAPDGDGRVTLDSALLPGVRTWKVDSDHSSLPDAEDAFAGYLELLQSGQTTRLSPLRSGAGTRGAGGAAEVYSRSRPARAVSPPRPPESARDAFASAKQERSPIETPASKLGLRVVNGDLTFVAEPLLLGHYRSSKLTGAEHAMDLAVGGAMSQSLGVGLYPTDPGTHQTFVNTRILPDNVRQMPRPEAVIVAGLGEEGKLRAAGLVETVRQAAIAWAQRIAERPDALAQFKLAATLIGSGGPGISAGLSAQLVAQGVRCANERLRASGWPLVAELVLIEIYADRASEAWRALQVLSTATPGAYEVYGEVKLGNGWLPSPLDSSYRGAEYDFISATSERDTSGNEAVAYTLDTKRARSEVRAQQTQGRLLRQLILQGSNDRNTDPQIGRTLFRLLIPVELEPFLSGSTEMQIELDRGTAAIPWELLDTDGDGNDPSPWAVRAKLLRKLKLQDYRMQVRDADSDAGVLIIGEPRCDADQGYGRLPAARREARIVYDAFEAVFAMEDGHRNALRGLIASDDPEDLGPDANTVITNLFERDWRVVHICGHGAPPDIGDPRGVVLSDGVFLGPREIRGLRVVPELVFLNCCYLAARPTEEVLRQDRLFYDRPAFAAGVAHELIEIGVRCVITSGWAVDDEPAQVFATTFYKALLAGRRFLDAVAQARAAAFAEGGNTWAAYQCYGDPDWVFRAAIGAAQGAPKPPAAEFAGVASEKDLKLALQTLAVRSRYQKAPSPAQLDKLRYLETRFEGEMTFAGGVAERFGDAYAAAGERPTAIRWYERACAANDASASLKAVEQLGNLRVRQSWASIDNLFRRRGQDSSSSVARGPARRLTATDQRALRRARSEIIKAAALLRDLATLEPSIERYSLCGSAAKRVAMLELLAGRSRQYNQAIGEMTAWYARAERMAIARNDSQLFYPALNRMAGEVILAPPRGWRGFAASDIERVRQNVATKTRDDPDFWSIVAQTELSLYVALAQKKLASARPALIEQYEDLHRHVGAVAMWESVLDQLDFVLPTYQRRAADAERRAARALREGVAKLVQGSRQQ